MNRSFAQTGIFLIFFVASSLAQTRQMADSIRLVNPSFEDVPKQSSPPLGWADCGFTGESAPDVHPSNFWEVSKPALNGKTYVGLVVRNNDTWERISQMLESPLQGGQCYNFSVYISSSENYKSRTNVANAGIIKLQSDSIFNFNIPAVLRIWAGNISCGRSELLAESPPIDNFEWKRYDFRLKPKSNYNYIMFEAFFKTPVLFPYNGNILLDHASSLQLVPCSHPVEPPKPPVVAVKPKPLPPPKDTAKPPGPVTVQAAKPKVGEIIKINNLYFNANSDSIPPHSYSALDDLYKYLLENESLVVEIGGHTNGLPKDDFCDSLSALRAKAVAEYLMQKGIPKERMTFVGYGRRKPIDTNATREGRARNQRVELKILSS